MKKIISVVITLSLILVIAPVSNASYSDVIDTANYYQSALRLQDLEILSGYEDGSFRPDNSITRAEFTKIVVSMMDKETEAKATAASSGFYDVKPDNWASPYINYAVSKNILSGYSDGSFGPDKTIRLCEAVTILLRTIGYDESMVGHYWPDNYMNAAKSLGLTDGMNYSSDALLTRGDAAILTDRTLFTKPANAASEDTYIESLGYNVLDDVLVLDKDNENDNITIIAGNLKLNNASAYIEKTQMPLNTGDIYEHAVVDKNGYISTIYHYGTTKGIYSKKAVINELDGDSIKYTLESGLKESYKAADNFVIYYENSKMNFLSVKDKITNGAEITFYGNSDGLWSIAVLEKSIDVKPVLASHDYYENDIAIEGISINKDNLVIYRDGEAAELSDIKQNDVVYYNTKTNTVDVYSKKVTGTYYSAYPSKAYVESITVGGKSYEIGYSSAKEKLDASKGAFEIGDKVTLLLGKDEKIAFVIDDAKEFDYFGYGVIISSSTKTATEGKNDGNTEFLTQIFMPDGQIHDIVTDKLYKDDSGTFVRIEYSDGIASLKRQSVSNIDAYAGQINIDEKKIGSRYLLEDAVIIQRTSSDDATLHECELLDFDELTAKKLEKSHIINVVSANSFGDVAILYVKNLETTYKFGVITGFEKNRGDISGYKIFSEGVSSSYSLGNLIKISTATGEGVGFKAQNGTLSKIISLAKVAEGRKIAAIEEGRVMIGNTVVKMAEDVVIADITSLTNIREITINELKKMQISQAIAYSDKALSNGGIVRVLTVKTN